MTDCKVEDCTADVFMKGFCKIHYGRQWRHGDPSVLKKVYRHTSLCSTDGCNKVVKTRDLCRNCYARWYNANTPGVYSKRRAKTYGLTHEEYLELRSRPCDACGNPELGKRGGIDHCHKTGQVRGVLCANCNIALGHLQDDPARVSALLRYLTANINV